MICQRQENAGLQAMPERVYDLSGYCGAHCFVLCVCVFFRERTCSNDSFDQILIYFVFLLLQQGKTEITR